MNNWKPAREVWADFCKRNPGFGLNGGDGSYVWLIRTHACALSGVLKKTINRRWLADAESFDAAAFNLLTGEASK
jgi:hypothetical protein